MAEHTIYPQEIPQEVSSFLKKTYSILMDSANNSVIDWSACGTRFSILDHHRFQTEVLPVHFKHNNHKSFVRQLNIHGFKKFSSRAEKGHDYYNENFIKGKPHLMSNILRISVKNSKVDSSGDEKALGSAHNSTPGDFADIHPGRKAFIVAIDACNSSTLKPAVSKYSSQLCISEQHAMLQAIDIFKRFSFLGEQKSGELTPLEQAETQIFLKTRELFDLVKSYSQAKDSSLSLASIPQEAALGKRASSDKDLDSLFVDSTESQYGESPLETMLRSDASSFSEDFNFGFCD